MTGPRENNRFWLAFHIWSRHEATGAQVFCQLEFLFWVHYFDRLGSHSPQFGEVVFPVVLCDNSHNCSDSVDLVLPRLR